MNVPLRLALVASLILTGRVIFGADEAQSSKPAHTPINIELADVREKEWAADEATLKAGDACVISALRRGETVLASTKNGLFEASLKEKKWRKLETPPEMPTGGIFMQQEGTSAVIIYYTRTFLNDPRARDNGLHYYFGSNFDDLDIYKCDYFLSKDSGKTWTKIPGEHKFREMFADPGGTIYAFERIEVKKLPPEMDATKENASLAYAEGTKTYRLDHLVMSQDGGMTWKAISKGLPVGFKFSGFFQNPDNAGLVCFIASTYAKAGRVRVYRAGDSKHEWKGTPVETWHDGMLPKQWVVRDFGQLILPGGIGIPVWLSYYFKFPLVDGTETPGIRVETGEAAYTFRKGEPMIIPVKVVSLMKSPVLKVVDDADESICWGMHVLPEGKQPIDIQPRYLGTSRNPVAVEREKLTVVELSSEHPYERKIDLAKLYDFAQPGKYKIQLYHSDTQLTEPGWPFGGVVIEVTITP